MPDQPPPQNPEEKDPEKNAWRQFGRYTQIGFVLPASIVVGLVIGAALDRWLKTSWITLVGLLLGCVAGFVELVRILMKASKES